MLIPGLGALVRAVRGLGEGKKLDSQKEELGHIAGDDVLLLVPDSYRPCAELRLRAAESQITAQGDGYAPVDIVQGFEDLRKAGLSRMMEKASQELATKDEVIRLVHALEQYAKASEGDIRNVDMNARQMATALQHRLDEQNRVLRKQLDEHGGHLASLQGLYARVDEAKSLSAAASEKIDALVKGLRTWLFIVGGLSLIETACLIYLAMR